MLAFVFSRKTLGVTINVLNDAFFCKHKSILPDVISDSKWNGSLIIVRAHATRGFGPKKGYEQVLALMLEINVMTVKRTLFCIREKRRCFEYL